MIAAILSGGSSLRSHLPFDPSPYAVIVAVNDAGTLAPHHHWAAFDKPLPSFRAKFVGWRRVDWGREFLIAHAPTFPRGPRYTFPMALECLQTVYRPAEIHAYGVDMDGLRIDGNRAKANRWTHEEQELRKLDLSRVTWFGRWRP
jgi:hypothetical protein